MKNILLGWAAALAMLAGPPAASAKALDPAPVVLTTNGALQGQPDKGVYSFLGVHYGADTAGKNRFLPAKPVEHWSGVKVANKMGDRCPQPEIHMPKQMADFLSFSDDPISEDCLVVNVWTPSVTDHKKRPIMFWIHGGGFFLGSGNDHYYEGANLARTQDVVVVTVNHRLNAFGYLALGPEAGPAYAESNLVGMFDIVDALKWVHANAAKFGGDAGNVTIYGQSGGGSKVSTLLTMPAAHGLFAKAIVESGAAIKLATAQDALATRDQLYASLGVKPSEGLAKLQSMSMAELTSAGAKLGLLAYTPAVDGKSLPTNPFDPKGSPLSADVPIMVGTTKDEATNTAAGPDWATMTDADLEKKAAGMAGPEHAKEIIALYHKHAPGDSARYLWTDMLTDQMMVNSAITLAERKYAQHRAPVYMYKVTWETPVMGGALRSPHAIELPFIFDNVDIGVGMVGSGPTQQKMADMMSATWAAFARTGNPNVPGLPHWPAYDPVKRATFVFNVPPKVVDDYNSAYRLYWKTVKPSTGANDALKQTMGGGHFK
jgi:para-nitrobenzyl esterase